MRSHFSVADATSTNIYSWANWVTGSSNHTLSFCEEDLTREYTKLKPISRKTLVKYLDQISFECEGKLSIEAPDKFALLFDGWDAGNSTNYCGVFISWYCVDSKKTLTYLLRLAPLLDLTSYSADSHIASIQSFLARIGKSWDNVVCIMGVNTETNLAIAKRQGKLFLGCYSHRLNLAVKKK